MRKVSVGQTWETPWSTGRMRHARVEGLMADGEIVRLRYLDNGEVANLDTLTLVFTPDVNWRLVSDAR